MRDEPSAGALVDEARSTTGLSDLGSRHYEVFLDAWCEDLASDRLSATGRKRLARIAVRNLCTRLRLEDAFRAHPEINDVALPPIVRIMGFPRSGTTLLHNLMAATPGRRALLRWELLEPLPPPEPTTFATDARIALVQRGVDALRGTELERMHWVEATDPEECTWGFADLTGLVGRGAGAVLPRWSAAVYDAPYGHMPTYVEYRRLIQLLLWRHPLPPDGVLVLKSPADTGVVQSFLEVFPEASVVFTHRDPYRVATSVTRIQELVAQPFMEAGASVTDADRQRLLDGLSIAADAMVDASQGFGDRVHHITYSDLMADPAGVVNRIWNATGWQADAAATTAAVNGFLESQRHGGRAAPPPSYDDHGLNPSDVRAEPSFARYQSTFNVPTEDVRLTQPN
ncbi:MAG: hypothetical protein QOF21_2892 [Actinomycetota bacterium]